MRQFSAKLRPVIVGCPGLLFTKRFGYLGSEELWVSETKRWDVRSSISWQFFCRSTFCKRGRPICCLQSVL